MAKYLAIAHKFPKNIRKYTEGQLVQNNAQI